MLVSHSQPLLSHHYHVHRRDNNGSDDDLSSGSGVGDGLWLPRSRRLHSYDDLVQLTARDGEIDDFFKQCHTTTGYVSFEDVIESEEFKEGSSRRRRPEVGISDPLVRATSRLYARGHPIHQRRSPGPLGTRRGGAMYRFIKKYVCRLPRVCGCHVRPYRLIRS